MLTPVFEIKPYISLVKSPYLMTRFRWWLPEKRNGDQVETVPFMEWKLHRYSRSYGDRRRLEFQWRLSSRGTYIHIYIYMCVCSNISDCWVCLKLFFTTKIVIWIRKTRISHWVLGTRFFRYTHVQPPSEWHQSEDDLSDLILFCTDVLGSYSCGWLHDPAPPTGWLKPYT